MYKKDDLKKEVLYQLRTSLEVFEKNDYPSKEQDIVMYEKMLENIDEVVSIYAAHRISDLLDAYHDNYTIATGEVIDMRARNLGIEKGDEVFSMLRERDGEAFSKQSHFIRDEYRQRIYEDMGFEGTLPTHEEINNLQSAKNQATTEEEKLELEKQIELRECALGELPHQFDQGLPRIISADIQRRFQTQMENAVNVEQQTNITR